MAYIAKSGDSWFFILDGVEGRPQRSIAEETNIVFSPDSQRLAFWVVHPIVSGKGCVVLDRKTMGKTYDGIGVESLCFSPDSKHVAYSGCTGDKWCVVVDEVEGSQYDDILDGGKIIFDSPDSLHYLALKGKSVYLVEESIE